MLTACHPKIKLSKLSNGESPHFTVVNHKLVLATKYTPLSKQDFIGVLFSGGSNYDIKMQNATGFTLSTVSLRSGQV